MTPSQPSPSPPPCGGKALDRNPKAQTCNTKLQKHMAKQYRRKSQIIEKKEKMKRRKKEEEKEKGRGEKKEKGGDTRAPAEFCAQK